MKKTLKTLFILSILILPQVDYDINKNGCCPGDEDGKVCYPVKVWKWCWCQCL